MVYASISLFSTGEYHCETYKLSLLKLWKCDGGAMP
jgi:hypothetical protein